ncbi:MAG: hypothetical protein DHS20C18_43590 [Saprospiraceae bacterium]|nr:MAG: hypothetical protein DHS20C18_43590 [Saprospiraceae bacterium]
MKNILFLSLVAVSFSACELTVETDLPDYEKQMVVHCYPSQETFSTTVSTTVGLLENKNPELLEDANVELYENDQLILSLSGNTAMPMDQALTNGQKYTLKVTHPDFEAMEATQVMPNQVPVKKAVYKMNSGVDDFGDQVDVLQISIDDPAGEENYYEFGLFIQQDPNFPDAINYLYPAENNSLGVSVIYSDLLIANDQLFDGQSYTISAKFNSYYHNDTEKYILMWRNITKERYLYLKSVTAHVYASDDPFAEPVGLFSNFDQGLGVFALYNEATYDVEK